MKRGRTANIFDGKVAIITGAGSGIGKGLAEELARRGAVVVISDVDAQRIAQVADGIRRSGGNVTSSVLDVADYGAVKNMIEDAVAEHGRVDYIFNNAGIAVGGAAKDFSIDDWRCVIDVNLYGVVNGVAVSYPLMVKQGFGHIINTASIEGLAPFPATASYVASKYGVVGLSSALRIEGAEHGIKVSAVCPGYVKTAIFTDSKQVNIDKDKVEEMPDWTGVSPEECARTILRGVERNDAIILVTLFAKFMWALNRLSPGLVIVLMRRSYRQAREKGILK